MEQIQIQLTQSQADLVDVLLGQMSDGKWENNRSYEKYWKAIRLQDNNILSINISSLKYASWSEAFQNEVKTVWEGGEQAIKNWLARKAQIVHNEDLREMRHINPSDKAGVARYANEHACYMDRGVNQTYGQIQAAIDSLKG